jgi:hypothetical protein
VTAEDFRRIALSFSGATESSHMEHPDFRVAGKVFATLGYPDKNFGMVKLRLEQQESFARAYPKAFAPVNGGWGARGATQVQLENTDESTLRLAITTAYKNITSKLSSK